MIAALRRTPHDREILRLAVLALGALAAQPTFVLVDTAVVGHLGTPQLAALGAAGLLLGGAFAMFNFLAYGTTSQVTRAVGAGARETADRLGAQAFWLSFALGTAVAVALGLAAEPLVGLIGVDGQTAEYAVQYLQIAVLGLPFSFLLLGGQGYFRGISDLRTPLLIEVVANGVNIVLVTLFVYGFGWGIQGSAAGTAISQAGMGLAFLVWMLRVTRGRFGFRPDLLRRLLVVGRHLFVRTVALYASFLVAGAAAARFGDAALGAHQIAIQLWYFLALLLDSVAIAGQVIVGSHARRRRRRRGVRGERADDRDDGLPRVRLRRADARVRGRPPADLHERPCRARTGARALADLRADAAAERRGLRARRDPDRRGRRPLPDVVDARPRWPRECRSRSSPSTRTGASSASGRRCSC